MNCQRSIICRLVLVVREVRLPPFSLKPAEYHCSCYLYLSPSRLASAIRNQIKHPKQNQQNVPAAGMSFAANTVINYQAQRGVDSRGLSWS
jgi:hypothetical protein